MAAQAVFQLPDGRVVQGPAEQAGDVLKAFPDARAMSDEEITQYDQAQLAREATGGAEGAATQFAARALQSLTPAGLMTPLENIEQLAATAVPVAKALAARFTGDTEAEARHQAAARENLELTQQYQRSRAGQQVGAGFLGDIAGLAAGIGGVKAATNMAAAASPAAAKIADLVSKSAGFNGLEGLAGLTQTSAAAGEALGIGARAANVIKRGLAIGAGMEAQELTREETTSKDHLAGSYIAGQLAHGMLSGVVAETALAGAGGAIKSLAGKYGAEKVAGIGGGALAGGAGYVGASYVGAGEPISALVGAVAAYNGGKFAANSARAFGEARQAAGVKQALDDALSENIAGPKVTPGAIPTAADLAASRTDPETRKAMAQDLLREYEELRTYVPQTADDVAKIQARKDAIEKQVTLFQMEDDAATAAQEYFDHAKIHDALQAMSDPKNPARHLMGEQLEELNAATEKDVIEATKAFTDTLKGQEVTQNEAYSLAKRRRFRQLAEADGVTFEPAQDVAVNKLAEIEQRINELAETKGITPESSALWRNQQKAVRRTLDQVAALKGEEATAGDVMSIMDEWKRQGQRDIAKAIRSRNWIGSDVEAFNGFRDLVDNDVRIWLENTPQFGERATTLQNVLNKATTDAISNREALAAAMATKFDRSAYDAYRPGFEADSAKVNALLSRMNGADNATIRKLVETQNARELRLANVVRENFELTGDAAKKIDAQIDAHERLGVLFKRAADRSIMQEALDTAKKTTIAGMAAEAAGNLSVAANAAKAVAMMQSNVLRERAVARMAQHVTDRIDRAVDVFTKIRGPEATRLAGQEIARAVTGREKPARGTAGARPRVEGAATPLRARAQKALESVATPKGTTTLTQAAKRAATVVALNQSPALIQKAIIGSVGAYHDERNPTLFDATALAAAKGFAYLQKNMPPGLKGMAQGNTQQVPQVSDAELAAWNRRVQAVQDPLSVLKDIESGTVTRDQAEALRVVHPAIYQQIHEKLIQAVANSKVPVPYSQRVMFFTLFDASVDRTLDPAVVQLLQANFQPRQGPQQAIPRMPAGRTFTKTVRSGADMIGQPRR